MSVNSLSWHQRFQIINELSFVPYDKSICDVFHVSQEELDSARELAESGHLSKSSRHVDPAQFKEIFMEAQKMNSHTDFTKDAGPMSIGTDKIKSKTGPKTSKLHSAFFNIPTVATDADAYAKMHGVSVAALRQGSRFDHTGLGGRVQVRKDRNTKALMVWRDPATSV